MTSRIASYRELGCWTRTSQLCRFSMGKLRSCMVVCRVHRPQSKQGEGDEMLCEGRMLMCSCAGGNPVQSRDIHRHGGGEEEKSLAEARFQNLLCFCRRSRVRASLGSLFYDQSCRGEMQLRRRRPAGRVIACITPIQISGSDFVCVKELDFRHRESVTTRRMELSDQ